MNVLWDWRLFSYGYRDRGVGVYCETVVRELLARRPRLRLFIWADRRALPVSLQSMHCIWIPYRGGTWKSSLVRIPWITLRYNIDLVHYWIALGPIDRIGLAPFVFAPAVATVHDMGVDRWGVPYCENVRKRMGWRMQKKIFRSLQGVLAVSHATLQEAVSLLPTGYRRVDVAYPPVIADPVVSLASENRQPYLVTLGGGIHKNCSRVVAAFRQLREKYPQWKLVILGRIDAVEEMLTDLPDGVMHEPSMERYGYHLDNCSGLLFCSLYEGLGIPPLEAMRHGCPLVLSAIPPLKETCGGAARFVDPLSVEQIAEGIEDVIVNTTHWVGRSVTGAASYLKRSADVAERCFSMYETVTRQHFRYLDAGVAARGKS